MTLPTQEILTFWFGNVDADTMSPPETRQRWFTKDPAFDAEIKARFSETYETCAAIDPNHNCSIEERLAIVIVLDQLARNMFRDQAKMYAADAQGLAHAKKLVEDLDQLRGHHAAFALMPLMHSEDLEDQQRCLALFEALAEDASRPEAARNAFRGNISFAKGHLDVIARFGRFPHRNAIVGRECTEEEEAYLADPKAGW